MLFATKKKELSLVLIEGILKYWPFANCAKETLFLSELDEIIEIVEIESLAPIAPKLFRRIAKCIGGEHLQICDKAMCFFESEKFLNIFKHYKEITFPLFVPPISNLSEIHWHK